MTTPPDLSPDEPMRLDALRLDLVDTPIDERFERVTRLTRRVIGCDIVAISLLEADRQFFKSIQGLDVCGTSRDVSFCGHAILGDGVMVVPDARRDPRFRDNPLVTGPPHIVFYASKPLRSVDGYKVGTLCVIHREPRDFDMEDETHLCDLASMAEMALHSAQANALRAKLLQEVAVERRRALIDPLTRTWNRDGILGLARKAAEQPRVADSGIGVVMIDMDRFKSVNDTFGHAAGDEVLRVAARRMLAALRETDFIGRIGGDEFLCLVAPCDAPETVAEVAERVRARLAESPILTVAGAVSLSASLGVRYIEAGDLDSLVELIHSADMAMYACKRTGRNGVAFADDVSPAA